MEAPENTIPAIKKAWEMGVDAIEVDLRQTKDKELVSVHDASLARISNKTWSIARSNFKTLKATDVGSWRSEKFRGTSIAKLEEILVTVPKKKKIFIEIKPSNLSFEKLGILVKKELITSKNSHFLCFYPSVIKKLKNTFPDIPATLNVVPVFYNYDFESINKSIKKSLSFGISQHIDSKKGISLLKKFKEEGNHCISWTINNKKYMRELVAAKIDAIITDNPKKLTKVIKEKKNG